MTMAAAIESRNAQVSARSRSSRIATVDFFDDFASAETIWRSLEDQNFCTPYQRYDFLGPWLRSVSVQEGLEALIVVAYDRDRVPLVLLPLVLDRAWGLRI